MADVFPQVDGAELLAVHGHGMEDGGGAAHHAEAGRARPQGKRLAGPARAVVDQPFAAVRAVDGGGHDLRPGGHAGQGLAADALVAERQRGLARVADDLGQRLEVRLLVLDELRAPQGDQGGEGQHQRHGAGHHGDRR